MISPDTRFRLRLPRPTAWAGRVLVLVCGCLAVQVGDAQATVGFTGSYATSNWTLTNQTTTSSSTKPPYTCPSGVFRECVANFNTPAGSVRIYGGYALAGPIAQQTTMTADAPGNPRGQLLNFTMTFYGAPGDPNFYGFYQVGSDSPIKLTITSGTSSSLTASNVYVASDQTFTFGVYNPSKTSSNGALQVDGFDANPVPGPLPSLGAASCFAWSRRLRRRLGSRSPASPAAASSPGVDLPVPVVPRPLRPVQRPSALALPPRQVQGYADLLQGPRIPWGGSPYQPQQPAPPHDHPH